MYTWDYMSDVQRQQAASLPVEGLIAFMEFMAAACLNPWGVNLRPGETRERNMPNVHFGSGSRGIVSYLIYEYDRKLLVTEVTWAG